VAKYGDKWSHSIGINDLYFDFMAPSLQSAGVVGDGKPRNISAGDGSESAFQRIQSKQFQIGTVAEPLRLHGFQVIDELNRAFAGEAPSGYAVPVHLFTPSNVTSDRGPGARPARFGAGGPSLKTTQYLIRASWPGTRDGGHSNPAIFEQHAAHRP
jgi:ribose transport system substrate-binding protein